MYRQQDYPDPKSSEPGSELRSFFEGIEHVFWDLDHTLWDYHTNARVTLFELFDKHGMHHRMDHPPELFHEVYCRHNDIAWEQYRKGMIDKEQLRKQRFEHTLSELGTDPEGISALLETDFVALCPTKPHLIPGAREALHFFHKRYRQHIITNGFRETQGIKTRESGIRHFFDSVTHSEDIGIQKPHPDIFRHALEAAGATIENSVMIGDNYEADVLGAVSLGMRSVYFNPVQTATFLKTERMIEVNDLHKLVFE